MVGHIEPRGKSFRLVVSGGRDKDGKQIKYTKTIKGVTPKEAEKELALMVAEIEKGQFADSKKLNLNDFVARWLKDYAQKRLAPKTLYRYKELLDKRILPALGHMRIDQIRPLHIMKFYNNLQEEGMRLDGKPGTLSDRTILHHHRLLSSIMQDAVEWQVIHSNPLTRVPTPKVKRKPAPCYDEEQTILLFQALDNEPMKYKVIIFLDIASGLRRGELMGLTWDNVNFKDSTIEVECSSQYLPGQGTFTKDPKNETSKRIISIPSSVMALLKEYKKHQSEEKLIVGSLWHDSNRLFTTWDGKPMHPDTVSKWFPKFLKRYNEKVKNDEYIPDSEKENLYLPPITFHGLRHTSATLLIGQGLHVKTISSRLGHSNISTTMDIYGHTLKKADQEAADKLDYLFGNKERKNKQA